MRKILLHEKLHMTEVNLSPGMCCIRDEAPPKDQGWKL